MAPAPLGPRIPPRAQLGAGVGVGLVVLLAGALVGMAAVSLWPAALLPGLMLVGVAVVRAWRWEPHTGALGLAAAGASIGLAALGLYALPERAAALGLSADMALGVGGAGAAVALVALALFGRWQRNIGGRLPNLLRETYEPADVVERGGVQLVAVDWPEELEVGDVGWCVCCLQSVVDAERTVRLALRSSERRGVGTPHFTCGEVEHTLGPGEVVEVQLPYTPKALARGHAHLVPELDVYGRLGRRVRSWRAARLPGPASGLVRALGALGGDVGLLRSRSLVLEQRVVAQPDEDREADLPLAEVDTLWVPDAGFLPGEEPPAGPAPATPDTGSNDHGLRDATADEEPAIAPVAGGSPPG